MARVANWERERQGTGVVVHRRGRGVGVVRVDGVFAGRVIRVGTGWQAWVREPGQVEMTFVGWGSRRRDAVQRVLGSVPQ